MTQTAPETAEIVKKLAKEVTRSPNPPGRDLEGALVQLVEEVRTGEDPESPLDWAFIVSEAVDRRHR